MSTGAVIVTNDKLTTKYGREYGYASWRPESGTPEGNVVMLHSLGFDKHSLYGTVAQRMCEELNMMIYAFDLPGHGDSFIDMNGVTYDSIQDDVVDLIESLQIAPCHYVGCSFGSEIGLRTAINHSKLLKSVTVIGASTIESSKDDEQLFGVMVNQWKSKGMSALAEFVFSEPFIFGKTFLENQRFEQQRKIERERITNMHINSLHLWDLWVHRKVTVDYSRIKVPLLVMCGSGDEYFLPHAENLIAMVSGAKLKLLEDVGHECPIESPDETYRYINEFWANGFNAQ